ncbi:MAG: hypothetical protein Q9163_004632 [Psora crenata]
MEYTSACSQDNHNFSPGTEAGTSFPPSPYALDQGTDTTDHELEEDGDSASGSGRHSSSTDEVVFDMPSRRSSPRTSQGSDDGDLSGFGSPHTAQKQHSSSPFTPLKMRSPFRNPSSVRAMQTDITPPDLTASASPRWRKLYPSSRHGTPHSRSVRSHNSAMRTPSRLNPGKGMKKEYPLVLLHVSLLPLPLHYSSDVLEAVLPPHVLANWKLLQEKATPTVLERGVLIAHPMEDYEVLEERLLESLELKQPRILKCGHFHPLSEEPVHQDHVESDGEGSHVEEDPDVCEDCGGHVRDGRYGDAGAGNQRWDIKIFAANGLMRAGAWSAAWREMERVDVEVVPWMEESVKWELELRREEEERTKAQQQVPAREGAGSGLDDERLREIYGQHAQDYVDGLMDHDPSHFTPTPAPEWRPASRQSTPASKDQPPNRDEIPLWNLLRNYLFLASHDARNIAIVFLSALALYLAIIRGSSPTPLQSPSPSSLLSIPTHDRIPTTELNMPSPTAGTVLQLSSSVISAATTSPSQDSEVRLDEQDDTEQIDSPSQDSEVRPDEQDDTEQTDHEQQTWTEVANAALGDN